MEQTRIEGVGGKLKFQYSTDYHPPHLRDRNLTRNELSASIYGFQSCNNSIQISFKKKYWNKGNCFFFVKCIKYEPQTKYKPLFYLKERRDFYSEFAPVVGKFGHRNKQCGNRSVTSHHNLNSLAMPKKIVVSCNSLS